MTLGPFEHNAGTLQFPHHRVPARAAVATMPAGPASGAPLPVWVVPLLVSLFALSILMVGAFTWEWADARLQANWDPTPPAVSAAEARVTAEPTDPGALITLAHEYRRAGMLTEALESNRRALELDANEVAAHYNIGSILREMGDDTAAEVAFWDALEIDPVYASASIALGELYIDRGHYRSLLVAVTPAAKAHPEDGELQYLRAVGLEHTGKKREALDGYWRAMERAPGLADARAGYERLKGVR